MNARETNTYKRLKNSPQDNFPRWIIVHHTGGTDKYPLADTSHHTAEIIEQWHLSKGWDGIGYHFVIEKDGKIARGRPEHYHGAHTRGKNLSSIGIVLTGNFDAFLPTKAQQEALKEVLEYLVKKYRISKKKIVPHRKFARKTCYGRKLSDDWARKLLQEENCLKKYSNEQLLQELMERLK